MNYLSKRLVSTSKNTTVLKKPQLDLPGIIKNYDKLKQSIIRRQLPSSTLQNLDFIVENRKRQLELQNAVDLLRKERSDLGLKMKNDATIHIKERLSTIKQQIKPLEDEADILQHEISIKAESLPNFLDDSVPENPEVGEVVSFINCTSEQNAKDLFKNVNDHKKIGEYLRIMDFETASRISGNSWYYLIGDGALLEQALVQYALAKARKHGYKMVIPPSIVRPEVINACGFKPKDQNDEKQIYGLADESLSLTGTAEIPLGALHSSTIFESGTKFPIKYAGVSRSYRAEAGARGKDTKGLYRVHEFTKVELFHFTEPELAANELEDIKNLQVEIIKELGLSAKMINMPANDLGAPAMKKFDCEAWMPGRNNWGELSSSSNCGVYQARRLGIKYRTEDMSSKHVATLNGTCMAVPRVIVTIIEQNYDPETESIAIPDVLVPYMDGKRRIFKN